MTLTTAIRAALVWDVPTLRRINDYGAAEFISALELQGVPTQSRGASPTEAPLAHAAAGVAAELYGDPKTAVGVYSELAETKSRWTSLLGDFLLCWSAEGASEERYRRLLSRLKREKDHLLQTRLLWKLVTWSVDRGYSELVETLLLQALDVTPRNSMLTEVLRTEMLNLGFGHLIPRSTGDRPRPSGLEDHDWLSYPWITAAAHESARTVLVDEFLARARKPGTSVIRLGPPGPPRVWAAQLQAEWAGAMWLLRPLRQQLAAQVLSTDAFTAEQVGYACVMWIAGGGRDTRSVLDSAEVRFGSGTAEYVVRQVATAYRPRFFGDRSLYEAVLALWDEITGDQALEILNTIEITPGDHPNEGVGRRAFLSLSIRSSGAWVKKFETLPIDAQRAVASEVDSVDISLLSDAVAEQLAQVLFSKFDLTAVGEIPLAAIAVATRTNEALARSLVMKSAPEVVARTAAVRPDLVDAATAEHAAETIAASLSRSVDEAIQGRYSLTSDQLFDDYGQLLLRLTRIRASLITPVERLVFTSGLPLEMRFAGLRLATQLALNNKISARLGERILRAPVAGQSVWNLVSEDLIEAQKLLLRVSLDKKINRSTEAGLFVASRHPDPRVRSIPLLAIHHLGSAGGSSLIDAVLFGALYDPDRSVTRNALAVLSEIDVKYPPASALIVDRIRALYLEGNRDIRHAVLYAAYRMRAHGLDVDDLMRRAAEDRSWLIRQTADRHVA